MGKKKSQQHMQQSMGQMISRAAIAQLGPQIEQMVRAYVQNLGQQLAVQQASTLETIFARVVVLEQIVIEKLGLTESELAERVNQVEDKKENLTVVTTGAELGDLTRLEISTKTKDQTEYQGSTKVKVYNTGSGDTFGPEIEKHILGTAAGETKEFSFGKDLEMNAKITMNRVSRPAPSPKLEVLKQETDEGVVEQTAGLSASNEDGTQDASTTQG